MGRGDESYLRRAAPSPGPRVPASTNSGDTSRAALGPSPTPRLPGRVSFPRILAPPTPATERSGLQPWRAPSPGPRAPGVCRNSGRAPPHPHLQPPPLKPTHLRRTGLGPTPGETKGRGARAAQKQAAPPQPYPCRLWEKFQAALQRAAGRSRRNAPPRRRPGLARRGREVHGSPPALFPSSRSANYRRGASVARVAGRPRRQLSMLGGGCSC